MGYRKAVSAAASAPTPGVKDPLAVLAGILGVAAVEAEAEAEPGTEEEMPSIEDGRGIEFAGLSLEEFVLANQVEGEEEEEEEEGGEEGEGDGEGEYSEQSAEECEDSHTNTHTAGLTEAILDEREKEKFQDLHRSIKACDEVLESVESYLSAFQTDLGTVSGEIESLQARSMSLSKQLENRKAVEKLLGPVVDDVVIPPHDVRRLMEGDVNDSWVKALYETDRRMMAIGARDPAKVKAVQEVLPELEKITHKVPLPSLSGVFPSFLLPFLFDFLDF